MSEREEACIDALRNMSGAFDTPVERRRRPLNDFQEEAVQSMRAALELLDAPHDSSPSQPEGTTGRVDLEAIQARVDAATPGEWRNTWDEPQPPELGETCAVAVGPEPVVGMLWYDGLHVACSKVDAEFIAHAHQDVPALVAEVRALRRRLLEEQSVSNAEQALKWDALGRLREAEAELAALRAADEKRTRWMHENDVRAVFHDPHSFALETCNSLLCIQARHRAAQPGQGQESVQQNVGMEGTRLQGYLRGVNEATTKLVEPLQARVKVLEEALRVYARRYESKGGTCWNWTQRVCDSFSGEVDHFDYIGSEQDAPWEIAERALTPPPSSADTGREEPTTASNAGPALQLLAAPTCHGWGLKSPDCPHEGVAEPAPQPKTAEMGREEPNRLKAFEDLAEFAWGVIANAGGGDWEKRESATWRVAAAEWREQYFALLPQSNMPLVAEPAPSAQGSRDAGAGT